MSNKITGNDYPSKEVLITMLRFALLEIRATDKLQFAKSLADIFHNLPAQLMLDWNDDVNMRAYDQILKKAQRYRLESYILELQKSART